MMVPSQIFAHRGANHEAAENTLAAFDAALCYPIDGIETDVQLSQDQQLVLWHDRDLAKLGLPQQRIDDFKLADLLALNFGVHFDGAAPPQKLVLLDDFLAAYQSRCCLLIEVKNRSWETAARQFLKIDKTLALLAQYQFQNLILSSFHLESLVYGWQQQPACPFVYNLEPDATLSHIQDCLQQHAFLSGYCLPIELLTPSLVGLLRQHQKQIAVYTCNTDAEIQLALSLGVDVLISDLPSRALALLHHAA